MENMVKVQCNRQNLVDVQVTKEQELNFRCTTRWNVIHHVEGWKTVKTSSLQLTPVTM